MDWGLVVVTLALAGFSLALIWSTNQNFFTSQLIFFIIGFLFFFFISQFDSDSIKSLAIPFYIFSLVLLLLSLLNSEIRGASRWIEIFGIGMQPSELVKPLMIVSFAYFMTQTNLSNLISLVKYILLFILPVVIIFFQPDLGNVIIYCLFLTGMLLSSKLNIKVIVSVVLLVVLTSPLLWGILREYQRARILSFLSPENDPQGAGYNAIQAMIAVGSGGLFGQGLGRGTQSHLRFLPENHTDFIFASLSEELGLLGALLLLFFYAYIFIKFLKFASETTDRFQYLVIIGIFTQILSQVFINISMNIGIIPITGITLPLLSSGGSSIISTFISLGVFVCLKKDKQRIPLVIR